MTTTHTFQGLNTDNKPSSRVLNPPGGSSSNIFGSDDLPKQQTSNKNIQESTNRNKNDTIGRDLPTAAAGAQQKAWAPRSGGDSIDIPCGIYQSLESDKAFSSKRANSYASDIQNQRMHTVGRLYPRSKYSSADTFLDLFGEKTIEQRNIFRRVKNINDDSFSRIFGQTSVSDSKKSKNAITHSSTLRVDPVRKCEQKYLKSGVLSNQNIDMSHFSSNKLASKLDRVKQEGKAAALNQALLKYMFPNPKKRVALSRKFSPKSAFNPITGEPYHQTKPKQELLSSSAVSSEDSKTLVACISTTGSDQASASATSTLYDKPQPEPAIDQQKQQPQSGIFGHRSEDVKEHTSTRVSQPPGGRSSKLW